MTNLQLLALFVALLVLAAIYVPDIIINHRRTKARIKQEKADSRLKTIKSDLIASFPKRNLWTEAQTEIAVYIALYGNSENTALIEDLAILMKRTPSSLERKIARFKSNGVEKGSSNLDWMSYNKLKHGGPLKGIATLYESVRTLTTEVSFLNSHISR